MDLHPESDRLCSLTMKGKLLHIHVPAEEKDEEQTELFNSHFERLYLKALKHDIKYSWKILMCKLIRNMALHQISENSLHNETNDNGWRITEFAMARSKEASDTLFQYRSIHL
jgi:hypothetical protein